MIDLIKINNINIVSLTMLMHVLKTFVLLKPWFGMYYYTEDNTK